MKISWSKLQSAPIGGHFFFLTKPDFKKNKNKTKDKYFLSKKRYIQGSVPQYALHFVYSPAVWWQSS